MSDVTAVGDLVGAGLTARAVEPTAGEVGTDGHTHESACLNCGAPLGGTFCQVCGQHAHVHRTISAFFHDLAHGVFHFEGKTWRTIPLLAWRPGELTRRYIDGQRARFVSPIALFLFMVFLMFAVLGRLGGPFQVTQINDGKSTKSLAQAANDARGTEASLQRQRAALVAAHRPTADIDRKISEAHDQSKMLTTMEDKGMTAAVLEQGPVDMPSGVPLIDRVMASAKANPALMLYKLENSAYKYSWMLIPLSVPFLWLLFPFSRRFRLYDHTVFVTYSLCFMSLLVVAATLLRTAGVVGVGAVLFFVPPIHMYRQLRGAYALGRWGALWRTVALIVVAVIASLLFAIVLFAVGVLD